MSSKPCTAKDLAASGLPECAITYLFSCMVVTVKEHCYALQVSGVEPTGIQTAGDRENSRPGNHRPECKVRDGSRHWGLIALSRSLRPGQPCKSCKLHGTYLPRDSHCPSQLIEHMTKCPGPADACWWRQGPWTFGIRIKTPPRRACRARCALLKQR